MGEPSTSKSKSSPEIVPGQRSGQRILRRRKPFKDYVATKSIDTIRKLSDKQIFNPEQLTLQAPISSLPHKLGKIYNAICPGTQNTVVRLIEFPKMPSYLIENVYLELCYRNENAFSELVPVLGVACAPQKLYMVMPKQELSLHQYIYEKMGDDKDRLRVIKYFHPPNT